MLCRQHPEGELKMRKIEYVVSDERLITPSGLSLVGQVLGKSNLIKKANRMRTEKRSQPQIKNGDILLTMIGLLSIGKSDFENVNEFHTDEEALRKNLCKIINCDKNVRQEVTAPHPQPYTKKRKKSKIKLRAEIAERS